MSASIAPRNGAGNVMFAVRLGLVGAFVVVGGCASSNSTTSQSYYRPSHVAAAPPADVEGDGMAPQAPPPAGRAQQPDDPREPWSPNYGSRPSRGPVVPAQSPAPVRPRIAAAD